MDEQPPEIALYFKSLDMYHRQRELYWTRVSAFLVLHGLLFTAASLAETDRRIIPFIAFFGICFSVIWMVVMYYGDVNIQKWEYVVSELEWDNDILDGNQLMELKILAPEPEPKFPIPELLKSKSFMIEQYLPILTLFLWISIPIALLVL